MLKTIMSLLEGLRPISRQFGSIGRKVYPWMDRQKPYMIDPKPEVRHDQSGLTEENAEFLQDSELVAIRSSLEMLNSANTDREQGQWIAGTTQRCGLVAIKLGMYPLWTKKGEKLDCTIFQIPDSHVIGYVPPDKLDRVFSLKEPRHYWKNDKHVPAWINHRRWGLQYVGSVSAPMTEFSQEWNNLFTRCGVPTKRKITRFLVSPDAALAPGTPLYFNHFRLGDTIDVTARTINRGFQGAMERYGFSGGPAAHGSTKFHRRLGSIACGGDTVIRGKRMHGLMGNRYRSARGKLIVRINPRLNLFYIVGPTPGPNHSFCTLNDSWLVNKRAELDKSPPPTPTWYPTKAFFDEQKRMLEEEFNEDAIEEFEFDLYHESLHKPGDPSISFRP